MINQPRQLLVGLGEGKAQLAQKIRIDQAGGRHQDQFGEQFRTDVVQSLGLDSASYNLLEPIDCPTLKPAQEPHAGWKLRDVVQEARIGGARSLHDGRHVIGQRGAPV